MLTQLKIVLLIVVCAAVVVQLGGCYYSRHERRSDEDRPRQHDRVPDRAELYMRVPGSNH